MRCASLAGGLLLVAIAGLGCRRSPSVEADIRNASAQPISLLEVDYPSASFGTESLAPNAVYHYQFAIIGSGSTKVLWTDAQHKDHSAAGPNLREGQHGTLVITISASGATWAVQLQP